MTVTFEIWQCRMKEDKNDQNGSYKCFLPLHYWRDEKPTRNLYDKVYERTDEIDQNLPIKRYLEQLFEEFNRNHPEDYKGRSMSTSDVVIVNDIPYFCDSVGFEQLEKF